MYTPIIATWAKSREYDVIFGFSTIHLSTCNRRSSVLGNLDYDLPNMLLTLQVCVCIPEMLKIEYLVDHRLQVDTLDQAVHVFKSTQG